MRARLVTEGTLSPEEAGQIADTARAEMADAVAFALQSPFPDPGEAVNFVYA
jgi:TPP-dependent pyruvate/acetoin dehydrogenase alpha subunit